LYLTQSFIAMSNITKKELLEECHEFLGSTAWIKEKPSGLKKYEVNLGRNFKTKLAGIFYGNKKVGRTKSFNTKNECVKYLNHLKELARNVDTSISTHSKRDYINAREALDKKGFTELSVTEAINKWLEHQPTCDINKTVAEYWEEFIEYKKTVTQVKESTLDSLHENGWKSLRPFLDLPITDFEQPSVRAKLRSYIEKTYSDPSTRQNHFIKTKEFFNHLIDLDEAPLTRNPLPRKTGYKHKRKRPTIATVEQVESILQVARETDGELGMLAFWVITFFQGCRPQSEMSQMSWDDVYLNNPDDSYLMVSEEGKTGRRRVDIYPNTYEWLMICNRNKPIFKWGTSWKTGKRSPSMYWYKTNRELILLKAGILKEGMSKKEKKIFQDFQRHTCASSMWRSGDFELPKIVNQLGHDIQTSQQYYLDTELSAQDAKRFWQIRPSTIGEKIVKIA